MVDLLIDRPIEHLHIFLAVHGIDVDQPICRELLQQRLDCWLCDVIARKNRRLELSRRVEMAASVVDEIPKAEKEEPRVARTIHDRLRGPEFRFD